MIPTKRKYGSLRAQNPSTKRKEVVVNLVHCSGIIDIAKVNENVRRKFLELLQKIYCCMLTSPPIPNDPNRLSDKGEIDVNVFAVRPASSASFEFKIRFNATGPTSDIANCLFQLISIKLGGSTVSRNLGPQKLRCKVRAVCYDAFGLRISQEALGRRFWILGDLLIHLVHRPHQILQLRQRHCSYATRTLLRSANFPRGRLPK